MSKTNTPRTENAIAGFSYAPPPIDLNNIVPADFARQLETELAEATRQREERHRKLCVATLECDQLRSELASANALIEECRETLRDSINYIRSESGIDMIEQTLAKLEGRKG